MRRRGLLTLFGGLALGCDRTPQRREEGAHAGAISSSSATSATGWRELVFERGPHPSEPQHAAVLAAAKDAPLLIALHGAGEAARGLVLGARGWRDDYGLGRADARLRNPPLAPQDFEGFVTPERLKELNAQLKGQSYRGVSVACPYTPRLRTPEEAAPFADFVIEALVPRITRELGLSPARLGIDGVSMGGRLALLVGFANPARFTAIGALQPALREEEAPSFAELASRAAAKSAFALRLVSSEDDPFLGAVRALARELTRRGITHELLVTPGPHDYAWNRGPGSIEMLAWHDRVQRP